MKDYVIEIKDGHHVVRMLSDEEIQIAKQIAELFNNVLETVREVVENIVTGLSAWIKENNIIELLEEYENDRYSIEPSGHFISADTTGETGHCDAGTAGD